MANTQNGITTLSGLKQAREDKKEAHLKIDQDYAEKRAKGQNELIKNIIQEEIPLKIIKIKDQLKNEIFKSAEKEKKNALKEINDAWDILEEETESYSLKIAADLKDKKEITSIKALTIEGFDTIVVKLANGIIRELDDNQKEWAKKYLAKQKEIEKLEERKDEVYKKFEKDIKDIEYTEPNFSKELSELLKITKLNICDLSELDERSYLSLAFDENSFELYKTAIQEIIKDVKDIYKEHGIYL